MLLGSWLITFFVIIGFGIYAGTHITKSDQWNGSDRSMGIISVGAMLGAWQIGGWDASSLISWGMRQRLSWSPVVKGHSETENHFHELIKIT